MSMPELFFLSVGLAMDAFAVAVCKGLGVGDVKRLHMIACGAYFGFFQALMPLMGYFLGVRFQTVIARYDHWIAFFLLGMIGLNMLREANGAQAIALEAAFSPPVMVPLAVATSIDALAVGVTFAFLRVNIACAAACIGLTTFALSAAGAWLGGRFGMRFRAPAEAAGGGILMLMGTKILLEHLLG